MVGWRVSMLACGALPAAIRWTFLVRSSFLLGIARDYLQSQLVICTSSGAIWRVRTYWLPGSWCLDEFDIKGHNRLKHQITILLTYSTLDNLIHARPAVAHRDDDPANSDTRVELAHDRNCFLKLRQRLQGKHM